MQTTADFLNAIKAKHGLPSNYALAKFMHQTDTDIRRWMQGKNTLSDEKALVVADLLEIDPAYVIACVHAEREKSPEVRHTWERIAARMAVAAAVAGLCALPFFGGDQHGAGPAGAAMALAFDNNIHYAPAGFFAFVIIALALLMLNRRHDA